MRVHFAGRIVWQETCRRVIQLVFLLRLLRGGLQAKLETERELQKFRS